MKTDTCRQALRAYEQRFYLLQYARCLFFFRNVMNYRDNKNKFQRANATDIRVSIGRLVEDRLSSEHGS